MAEEQTFADEDEFELLPADDEDLLDGDTQLAAAEASLTDDVFATDSSVPPIPFGKSWAWDRETGRYKRPGSSAKRVTTLDRLRLAAATNSIEHLLAAPTGGALADLGTQPGVASTLQNGAALADPGLVDGCRKAVLDGINDFILTDWATRMNLCPNPIMSIDLTGYALGATSWAESKMEWQASTFIESSPAGGGRITGKKDATATNRVVTVSIFSPEGSITPGLTYSLQWAVNFVDNVTKGCQIYLNWYKGAEFLKTEGVGALFTGAGVKVLELAGATAPATATRVSMVLQGQSETSADTFDIRWDHVCLERAATVGTFFPTGTQLENEEAGWSGAVGNSITDLGPFARGTKRTFFGVARRTDESTEDTLIGGSGAVAPFAWVSKEARHVVWQAKNGAGSPTTWANAWPGNEQNVFWAVVFDDNANTATLYLNGKLVSTQAHVNTYSDPGVVQFGALTGASSPFKGSELPVGVAYGDLGAEVIADLAQLSTEVGQPPGTAPSVVYGKDSLREWIYNALATAQGAHEIFSDEFGIEEPDDWIGLSDPTDATTTFEPRAREAVLQHDRVEEFDEVDVDFDPNEGVITVSEMLVITDDADAVPLLPAELSPTDF